jgi:hypothetical protein
MATKAPAIPDDVEQIEGLIDLGYERPDYSEPCAPCSAGETPPERKLHTVYPTFRVCEDAAAELHKALAEGKLLDGEFAAIVVLKNTMVRVADDDEDEDPKKDVELEFTVRAILPHVEAGDDEAKIMAEFEQLPKAVKDTEEEDEEEND